MTVELGDLMNKCMWFGCKNAVAVEAYTGFGGKDCLKIVYFSDPIND